MLRDAYVFAHLPGETDAVPAGRFRYDDDNRVGRFDYGTRYVDRARAIAVDPIDCPLQGPVSPTTLHDGLYGTFRDASPDWWGRTVIARRLRRDVATLDPFDLLMHGGPARVGALDFRESPDAPESAATLPQLTSLDDLVAAADALQDNRATSPEMLELLEQGTTLGGMRPKCVVVDGDVQWIAKFPARHDRFDHPRVEHAMLALARQVGIAVADTRLLTLRDGRAALLVRRFDRARHIEHHGWTRTAFASALTLLHAGEDERERWSYAELAAALRRLAVDRGDIAQLFRRMLFNAATRNTDDHPRNHAVLYDDERTWLAPAYDLVPQPAAPGVGSEFHLAMTVGEAGRLASLENLLSRGADFGLTPERAREEARVVGQACRAWPDVFVAAGIDQAGQTMFTGSFALAEPLARA